jgi:hypothetical protein
MGALIPNPMDQEIVFKLNTIFSGTNFQTLRAHNDGGPGGPAAKLFHKNTKKLSRIARRIGAYPQSMNDTDSRHDTMTGRRNPRARWYHFLESLSHEHDLTGSGPTTADAIMDALQNAITHPNIVGVIFNVTYTPSATKSKSKFLEPNNTSPGHIFSIGSTTDQVLMLTLICQDAIPAGAITHNNNPGPHENVIANMPWPKDDQNQI